MTRLVLIGFCFFLIGCVTVSASSSASLYTSASGSNANSKIETYAEPASEECDDDEPEPTKPSTPACSENEEVDDCPSDCSAAADYCPSSEEDSKRTCSRPTKCPKIKACRCRFNYRRAQNGTCIPTRDCPSFKCSGKNEQSFACPPICPTDDCSQASPTGECPPQFGNILITLPCSPKCRCRKGYWRKNGICVPYDECKTQTCGTNEILDENPVERLSDYCPKSEEEAIRAKNEQTTDSNIKKEPACKCRLNYRRSENGTCIPTRECPPFECSGDNEAFDPCPPYCPSDDCSQSSPDGSCPRRFGRIGILLICNPKCRCKKGYWRKDGVCIPYAECGNEKCSGPNEEFTLKKRTCPPEECFSLVARIDCRNATAPMPGCACKAGFLREESDSPCIPICQCPQMRNSADCM